MQIQLQIIIINISLSILNGLAVHKSTIKIPIVNPTPLIEIIKVLSKCFKGWLLTTITITQNMSIGIVDNTI